MKLKTRLLAGFTGVLGIFMGVSCLLTVNLNEIIQQSKAVDRTDSALADALIAQGRVLSFVIYQDESFARSGREKLASAIALANNAETFLSTPENKKRLDVQKKLFEEAQANLETQITYHQKRLEIEASVAPLAKQVNKSLAQLRAMVGRSLAQNFTENTMTSYVKLVEIGEIFNNTRVASWIFIASPSDSTRTTALNTLALTKQKIMEIQNWLSDPRQVALSQDLQETITEYDAKFNEMANTITGARETLTGFRDLCGLIVEGCVALSASVTNGLMKDNDMAKNSLWAGVVFSLLLGFGIALWLARITMKQLGKDPGELASIAQRVTNGDYGIDDGSVKSGVYGNLVNMVQAMKTHIESAEQESARAAQESARAMQAMQEADAAGAEARSKTQTMLAAADRLEEVANTVSSASTQLSAQIEQSERGASEQADRVTETATAMEEMNSTVIEVARNAGDAAKASTRTRQKAEEGANVVHSAVASIKQVQEQSLALKQDMAALSEHAQSISRIMAVISDIADQTNLLALNAAIEAARAGDAGRGFAVVADEVRKLAEKTMASTTDVSNAIQAIQISAERSTRQVEQAVQTIDEATALAERSGEALKEIVNMAEGTADQVRAIAAASEQQSASSEEINRSITQVNTIAAETAKAMEDAARAVSGLASQSRVLTGLIEEMKR